MIKAAVVDDNPRDLSELENLLKGYADSHGENIQIQTFQDGEDIALEYSAVWDVIFLDDRGLQGECLRLSPEAAGKDRAFLLHGPCPDPDLPEKGDLHLGERPGRDPEAAGTLQEVETQEPLIQEST